MLLSTLKPAVITLLRQAVIEESRSRMAGFVSAIVLGILALLACLSPAQAKSYKWPAASTTAYAITGDIRVSAESITFANGARIRIRPVSVEKPQVFTLVPRSANPTLLNGNKLCGDTPPTFIVLPATATTST